MSFNFQESPEERLFKAALGFADDEREAFIRNSADGDAAVTEAALLLLEGYRKMGGDDAEATMSENSSARRRWATSTEEPGTVIGDFTLIRKVGEGGMGTVWEAQQGGRIERRVAFKVIKLGMDTAEVLARFDRERQTLALLEQPNIAAVYEAGSTELGRPFFVMEFVEGEPITNHCAKHQLPLEGRLRLMLQLCAGIEHAHRKGVIHRDLKPSNILVNADGVPKIIDFGIAKAASDEGGTLFTREAQMLGTPAYMSPEQASGNAAAIDTRSDVYSLGVVLYELLAGTPPFDPDRLASTGFAEVQKILSEEDPPTPSTRQHTTSQASPRPESRTPHFEKDLDWIVMKSMAKEPDRRYNTATALAEDLTRYLDGEVVQAVPPSFGYRTAKFIRRNRTALLASVAMLLALGAGVVLTLLVADSDEVDPLGVVTPISVTSNTEDEGAAIRLIDGSGLSEIPTGENLRELQHSFSLSENSWVTLSQSQSVADYFALPDLVIPTLEFELEDETEIVGFVFWGHLLIKFGPDYGNEPKTFRLTFRDERGNLLRDPVEVSTEVPTRRHAQILALPKTKGVKKITVEILDNHFPFQGGHRVAMGELRFLSSDVPPEVFEPVDVASPFPEVFAARLKTSGELAEDLTIGHTPADHFQAGSTPDYADTSLMLDDQPLSQFRGVLIPSVAVEASAQSIIVRAPGELNQAPESDFDPPFPSGIWLSSNRAERGIEIANIETAFAYFPFSAGWAGGHMGRESRQIRLKNVAEKFTIKPLSHYAFSISDPSGGQSSERGALFVVSSGNLTTPEIVSTGLHGPSWYVVLTQGFNGEPVSSSWSFVYLPYDTEKIALGQVDDDGQTLRSGTYPFQCRWDAQGRHYVLTFDDIAEVSQGALLLTSCQSLASGRPVDCHFSWELSPDHSAFHIHPHVLPLAETAGQGLPCGFVFAYLPFQDEIDPAKLAARAEKRARLAAELEENRRKKAAEFLAIAQHLVTPIKVTSNTALAPNPDTYPAKRLIDGSGLQRSIAGPSDLIDNLHALSNSENAWLTDDHIPDYFESENPPPSPILTFTLAAPASVSGFVYWGYQFSSVNTAFGNEPSHFRFTFRGADGGAVGDPVEVRVEDPTGLKPRALPLPKTNEVLTIEMEILDNFIELSGGDRVGIGEVRFFMGGN